MKKYSALFALFLSFQISALAHASCEDGEGMAADAALQAAQQDDSTCSVNSSVLTSDPGRDRDERWLVEVKCTSFMGAEIYEVILKEIEDAWCVPASVRLFQSLE